MRNDREPFMLSGCGVRSRPFLCIAPLLYAFFFVSGMGQEREPNHLIHEESPYLLQHAYNPVDWYPWGSEAFEKAREEEKPIFLSIGFATCHWCHLMERDSFTDPQTARFLNEHFVSIKVDREERPDVDQIYMSFVQASTGKFGWPLTVFLTPDLKPFYGGSYFSKDSFLNQIKKIAAEWEENRGRVLSSAGKVTDLLRDIHDYEKASELPETERLFLEAYQWYLIAYDRHSGGFGREPKFPQPDDFYYLLRHHRQTGKISSLRMVVDTLGAMSQGGIHDQLAGGFHRYSVDADWHLPRFEKLLFIQAQLAIAYLELYQLTDKAFFAETARKTLDFVLGRFGDESGGFYSSLDASSPCPQNPEKMCVGAYYLWKWSELEKILGKDLDLVARYYGLEEEGNIAVEEFQGLNVLDPELFLEELSKETAFELTEIKEKLEYANGKLLEARRKRTPPPLDDKILTGWNGLMISALAKAAQVFDDKEYLEAAEKAARFIESTLYRPETGVLKRRYRNGKVSIDGYVDDYALLTQGLIDLYETGLEERWLFLALDLSEKQLALFWDQDIGGFFNSPPAGGPLLLRVKELYDGVEPSPNGISVSNFFRLAQITGEKKWKQYAQESVEAFSKRLQKSSHAMPFMRLSLGFDLQKPLQIILAGSREDPLTFRLLEEVHKRFLPYRVIILADGGSGHRRLSETLEILETARPLKGKPTAYICEESVCKMPTSDPVVVGQILDGEL